MPSDPACMVPVGHSSLVFFSALRWIVGNWTSYSSCLNSGYSSQCFTWLSLLGFFHLPKDFARVRHEPHSKGSDHSLFLCQSRDYPCTLCYERQLLSYFLGHLIMTSIGCLHNDFNKFRICFQSYWKKKILWGRELLRTWLPVKWEKENKWNNNRHN